MNALNAVAAVATVAACLLALWQFMDSRRAVQTERERIAEQKERLRTALSAAKAGAEAADLIVQRAKDETVTVDELQNIARMSRRHLALLVHQLEDERSLLAGWKFGRLTTSTPPRQIKKSTTAPDS